MPEPRTHDVAPQREPRWPLSALPGSSCVRVQRRHHTLTSYICAPRMCRMARRAEKTDLLQGTLDLLVLQITNALGPLHGYAIAQRLKQVSDAALDVQQGSLYPALHRL